MPGCPEGSREYRRLMKARLTSHWVSPDMKSKDIPGVCRATMPYLCRLPFDCTPAESAEAAFPEGAASSSSVDAVASDACTGEERSEQGGPERVRAPLRLWETHPGCGAEAWLKFLRQVCHHQASTQTKPQTPETALPATLLAGTITTCNMFPRVLCWLSLKQYP